MRIAAIVALTILALLAASGTQATTNSSRPLIDTSAVLAAS